MMAAKMGGGGYSNNGIIKITRDEIKRRWNGVNDQII